MEQTTCDYGANPSQKAYDCARYEQCDDCFMIDHKKECPGCSMYEHDEYPFGEPVKINKIYSPLEIVQKQMEVITKGLLV